MRKKIIPIIVFPILVLCAFFAVQTFGLLRSSGQSTGQIKTATWSISRSQSATSDVLEVIPDGLTDVYDLTVQSSSEVDIRYTIIISNIPTGVEVKLDDGNYITPVNNVVTINAGTINYNDLVKTKTHQLTFKANSSATYGTSSINVDVEFKQIL